MSTQKLTCYPSSLQWYAKLGNGIIGFTVACHFHKRTQFFHQRPKTPILQILGCKLQKIVIIYLQKFNAKTDQPSFLLAMVSKTWWQYYRFGRCTNFSKSDIKDWILSSVPKNTNFANFRWSIVKNVNFYLQSLNAKTDQPVFIFVMVYKT